MTDIIARDYVAAELAKVLPAGFRIEKFQRIPDTITGSTAILKQQRLRRQIIGGVTVPGARVAEFVLTLAVGLEDIAAAERDLDDKVVTLLDAIDGIANIAWTDAVKRVVSETTQAPCYDIALELTYQHNKEQS